MRSISKRLQQLEQDHNISDDVEVIEINDVRFFGGKPLLYTKANKHQWDKFRSQYLSNGMVAVWEDKKVIDHLQELHKNSTDDKVHIPFTEYKEIFVSVLEKVA
jgi:hypothetical protein